jgi:hypothetical protein
MLHVVPNPQNPDILKLINEEILGEAGWERFVWRSLERPDNSYIETEPLGHYLDAENKVYWNAWEDRTHQPWAIEYAGESARFLRHLGISAMTGSDKTVAAYSFSLRDGQLTGSLRNRNLYNFEKPIPSPRNGFLQALEQIFGKTVEVTKPNKDRKG